MHLNGAIVDFSGIEQFIGTQVKFYSSGKYVRLAFAVTVHVDLDIMLVDKVLAVGDEAFQRKCMDRIRAFQHVGRTIVLVTHSLDRLAEISNRAVVLESGNVIADGDIADALRTLRSEFDQQRQEQKAAGETAPDERAALPHVIVDSVELLDTEGRPITEVTPGSAATVAVTVDAREPVSQPNVGIGIENALEVSVFGTKATLLGQTLPTLVGRRRYDFLLRDLCLGGGHTLHGAVGTAQGAELSRLREASPFSVSSDGSTVFPVWASPELSTVST